MHRFVLLATLIGALSACGVETVGVAATAAAAKKQELEQGKKDMAQAQRQIDQVTQQLQQRAADQAAADK